MSSGVRRSGRKRTAAVGKLSDADIPSSSPSRPAAKKRKPNGTSALAPQPLPVKTPHNHGLQDDAVSDSTTSNAETQDLADKIIPHLSVAKDAVAVAEQWSNSNIGKTFKDGVAAYAKMCGREWTYYVKSVKVNIGRPPDAFPRQSAGVDAASTPAAESSDNTIVHIDLGPSKTISRLHAELFFDVKDSKWHVKVNGRNGMQVNETTLRKGQQYNINSGDVLGVAGTQMMFITAEDRAEIHPMFLNMIGGHTEHTKISSPWNDQPHAHPEPSTPIEKSRSPQDRSAARSYGNGQANIAPAPPHHVRLTTPIQSPRKSAQGTSGKKKSPAYGRGILMQSNEEIDYADDANKSVRPSKSYAVMIAQAINSTEDKMLTLAGIYEYIKNNFSFYRNQPSGWQNSIRHNLSLSPLFEKTPRRTNEPGKGMKWRLVDSKGNEAITKYQKKLGKGGRKSSGPSSPASKLPPADFGSDTSQAHPPAANQDLKDSPTSRTPPMSSYPSAAQESFTPSRGNHLTSQTHPVLSDDPSPLPAGRPQVRAIAAMGSSPTLTSGPWLYDTLVTPAPRPHNLNAPLPQTARLPTSHMADSSPAPFWKYSEGLGDTPARWLGEMSPMKGGAMHSSSPPPPATNGNESPTRGRGSALQMSMMRAADMDDEEGGIDLARGFPNISSYHQQRQPASNLAA